MRWMVLFSIFITPWLAHASDLWLKVGEVRRLPAARTASVRVGARGILRVLDGESAVKVIALKVGFTSLTVGDRVFLVHVTSISQKAFVEALRQTLNDMKGLTLAADNSRPTIEGTLLRFEDWLRIAALARRYQGDYNFAAQALPDVAQAALHHLRGLTLEQGYPIIRFLSQPQFVAEVPRSSPGLKVAMERQLKPFGIRIDMSDSDLALQPLVRTQVIVAEVSRGLVRDFGISWPGQYQAQVLPRLSAESDLITTLRAFEQRGQAQILASPNLLCRSGSEARFHAGGEFPVRQTGRFSKGVTWKSHGVLLKVKPRADFQGAISLEVETEVSLLDQAHAVDGVPALKSNSVKSHFDLPGRRTLALSGLIRRELGESDEGLAGLTALPILGRLFSSRSFQDRQSELVIFVTPEIHSPDADDPLEMPAGWIKQ